MPHQHIAPYGTWRSPISSAQLANASIGLLEVSLDGDRLCWIESRSAEQGRCVLMQQAGAGTAKALLDKRFSVRSRVHEYGGGAYLASGRDVFFVNLADQQIYRLRRDQDVEPLPVTNQATMRFADMCWSVAGDSLLAVAEGHTTAGDEPTNFIASIDTRSGCVSKLVQGADFYAAPRISHDGARLSWLTWQHPDMPWDSTELWLADFDAKTATCAGARRVAGGAGEAIIQPRWSPDGFLYFVSDRSGWWNLYRVNNSTIETMFQIEGEIGGPAWTLADSHYAFIDSRTLVCAVKRNGVSELFEVNTGSRSAQPIDSPYCTIASVQADKDRVVFIGASADATPAIVELRWLERRFTTVRQSSDIQLPEDLVSIAAPITYKTTDGMAAHGFFYRPKNPDYAAPAGELPPLIVLSHGGPTSATECSLKLLVQYWTSRGFAVFDVNYGGSSGYGRDYRQRLAGQWGVRDVEDCVQGAVYLAEHEWVDSQRMAIRGGSAGGYTTLCALTYFDVFKAGASHYGVSDLEALARDTHKFESRYLDRLVGPYPDTRDVYIARSPIHATDKLNCPIIFFQGLDDKVVPPNQAERMVGALRAKKLPVAYLAFPGEQHGFRKAATIQRVLDAECYFYAQVFGFTLPEPAAPVDIEYLHEFRSRSELSASQD